MKTLEMIKCLVENPKLKAERTKTTSPAGSGGVVGFVDGVLQWEEGFGGKFRIAQKYIETDEWVLIHPKLSVSFYTALDEWQHNGKNISCEIGNEKCVYTQQHLGTPILPRGILQGKWFIED